MLSPRAWKAALKLRKKSVTIAALRKYVSVVVRMSVERRDVAASPRAACVTRCSPTLSGILSFARKGAKRKPKFPPEAACLSRLPRSPVSATLPPLPY